MKKLIYNLFIVAVAMFVMVACSGKKLDTDRIMEYALNQTELTESDYDFFIDQMEVINGMTKDMDEQQVQEFFDKMPETDHKAVVIVTLVMATAGDKLTDAQKERLQAI